MSTNGKMKRAELEAVAQDDPRVPQESAPRSLAIAGEGIKTANQFAQFMSAMMCDLIDGRVTAGVGNAAVNAGGKLLKVVEMQMKYGTASGDGRRRELPLTTD
jgi:hypothetical protein